MAILAPFHGADNNCPPLPEMIRTARQRVLSDNAMHRTLGNLLTATASVPELTEAHWATLVRFAGDTLVAAQLYERLQAEGLLDQIPEPISEYLCHVHALNAERSADLVATFIRFVRVLNEAGVQPVAIKGISLLLGSMQGNPMLSSRITYDVDVLIHENELLTSLRALKGAGYQQLRNPVGAKPTQGRSDDIFVAIDLEEHRNKPEFARAHVPPFVDAEKICMIDLHTAVANERRSRSAALTRLIVERSSPVATSLPVISSPESSQSSDTEADLHYLLPSPASQLVLAVYHAQVKNDCQFLGVVNWRLLLDMVSLLEAHPQIDLLAETMRLSQELDMDKQMYTAWVLVHRYLATPLALAAFNNNSRQRALQWFDCKSRWRWLSRSCLLVLRVKKLCRLLGPNELRHSLGDKRGLGDIVSHLNYRIRRSLKSQ